MDNGARLKGLLGIAQRAGKLITGMDASLEAIKGGKAAAGILDGAASENARKKLQDACIGCHVPLIYVPNGLLESACGRSGRVTGVLTDQGFAQRAAALTADEGQKPIA